MSDQDKNKHYALLLMLVRKNLKGELVMKSKFKKFLIECLLLIASGAILSLMFIYSI